MKRNSKKLVVLVIIAAITMFSVTAMAWDNKPGFRGHYAVTVAGHNLVSTTGFDNDFNPNPCPTNAPPSSCLVFQDIQVWSGDLRFNKDGTGSFTWINRGIGTPPGAYNIKTADYEFIYTMTSDRTFTYQMKPGTYLEVKFLAGGQTGQIVTFEVDGYCKGVLSQDLQNVIVTCGPTTSPPDFILTAVDPNGNKLPIQAILSQSIVGIRVNK